MSKCSYCEQRKGKRPCPALSGFICSQCCGTFRMNKISCPPDCVYLDSNHEYQQKRVGALFEQDRRTFYKELMELGGERAAEVFYVLEALTYRFFQSRPEAQDGEIIDGLTHLRQSFSPIHIPGAAPAAFGEELKKEYKTLDDRQPLDTHMATQVLDRASQFIQGFSGEGLRSNRFLSGLIGYIKLRHPDVAEQLARQSGAGGRIIIPSGAPLEDSPSSVQQP